MLKQFIVFIMLLLSFMLRMGFANNSGYKLAIQLQPGSNTWDCLLVQHATEQDIGLCPDNPITINRVDVTLVWWKDKYSHEFDESCQNFQTIKLSDYIDDNKRTLVFKTRLHVDSLTSKHVKVMDCELK